MDAQKMSDALMEILDKTSEDHIRAIVHSAFADSANPPTTDARRLAARIRKERAELLAHSSQPEPLRDGGRGFILFDDE